MRSSILLLLAMALVVPAVLADPHGELALRSIASDAKFWSGAGRMEAGRIEVDGQERTFFIYTPDASSSPRPLVIAFHGGGGRAARMDRLTGGITGLADQKNFLVAFPQGINRRWKDGRKMTDSFGDYDDVVFISELIDRLVASGKVDAQRVYCMGISNGGFFSQYMALRAPEKIAGIASVAATVPESLARFSRLSSPVPVLFILGDQDPLIPHEGGRIGGTMLPKQRGRVLPADKSVDFWLKLNGNDNDRIESEVKDRDQDDGTRVVVISYADGSQKDVEVHKVEGGGHTWPMGWQYLPKLLIGKTSKELNANQAIWEFFQRHRKTRENDPDSSGKQQS